MDISVVVLVGGKSSRMGKNKAFLKKENHTFIEIIAKELSHYQDFFLSVDSKEKYENLPYDMVEDIHQGIGPIEGIVQSLKYAENEYLFVCAVDMPFFRKEIVSYLTSQISPDYDVYFLKDESGVHSLCGIYSKKTLSLLEESIADGVYRIRANLDPSRVKILPLSESGISPEVLKNVNTPEEYQTIK